MEGDGHSETVEWIVENFSCWNNAIHGECLRESQAGFALYPRGLFGAGENLVLRISEPFHPIEGELSFVSSNGSIILWKTALNETHKQEDHVVVSGPKYRDVIAQAKNEASHKDTLTLRCTLKKDYGKKYCGHTAIDVYDASLKIPGEAFKDIEQERSKLISTMCYTLNVNKEEIEIVASATGSTSEDGKVSLKFKPKSRTGDVLIRTYISIQNSNGVVVKSEENDYLVLSNSEHKFADLLDRKVLVNGCSILLRIKLIGGVKQEVCYISEPFVNYYKNIPQNQNTLPLQLPMKSVNILLQELMCLYQDQEFTDFELHCGNIIFPTHRSILSARSPVFKSMLSHDMREATSRSMDIPDLDPHTLGRFLIFLYTGIVKDLTWKSALTLYYAADKYQVPSLKDECSSVLRSKVSISNVCDILSLAEKHQDEGLNSAAHKFILENYNDVLRSEEWESHMEEEPYLLLKTLTSISKKSNIGQIKVRPKIPLTQSTSITPSTFNFGGVVAPASFRLPTS